MLSPFRKIIYGDIPAIPSPAFKILMQWYLFFRVIILTILLGIGVLLQTKSHDLIIPSIYHTAYFIAGVYLFTIISALLLRYIKNYWRFALFQTVVDSLMASIIVYATGGSLSIFTIIYFIPILTASFLLLRLGGLLIASISTISYGYILLVEILYQPTPFTGYHTQLDDIIVAMHYFAIHGIVFFIIGILSLVIFERMRFTESALTQSTLNYDRLEILYKQIFDDITTGIITVDDNGKITSFNRSAEQISGLKDINAIGSSLYDLFPGFEESDEPNQRQTTELTRGNKSIVPIGYSWARLNMPGDFEDCRVYTMQDLSQIREMEQQIKQSEKMATIGEMAAGIAHEFRNPLAAISGAAQILQSDMPDEASTRRLISIVNRESERLDGTVDEFLLFSKPASPVKEWFSLKAITDDTIQMLEQGRQWEPATCRIITRINDDHDVWGDSRQISRVLLNLISNSCQAFGDNGGEITIEAYDRKVEDGKDESIITISDNGPGISEKVMPHVFEPFYTTRESGTGLGLSIVKQLVESHDGQVIVDSEVGNQTAFTISLPVPK